MTNNELSKKILLIMRDTDNGSIKFSELSASIGDDKKRIAQNLFYLEANHFVEIRGVYNSNSLFPEIYLVTLKPKGVHVSGNADILEAIFPSELDQCMINVCTMVDNILKATELWASGDKSKMELYESLRDTFKSEKFSSFLEDVYGGHKSK